MAFGVAVSLVSFARALKYFLEIHPVLVWSFFFGMILASSFLVIQKIERWNVGPGLAVLAGAVSKFSISVISPAQANEAYWFVSVSGAIAICAMILPGISGGLIWVLLDMYEYLLGALGDLNFLVLGIYVMGAGIGIVNFSILLSWLFKQFQNITIAVLAGFTLGSLNKVWP